MYDYNAYGNDFCYKDITFYYPLFQSDLAPGQMNQGQEHICVFYGPSVVIHAFVAVVPPLMGSRARTLPHVWTCGWAGLCVCGE